MAGATEDNYWPDSGVENVDNPGSEDDQGEHVIHITRMAAADGFVDLGDTGLQNLVKAQLSLHGGFRQEAEAPNDVVF